MFLMIGKSKERIQAVERLPSFDVNVDIWWIPHRIVNLSEKVGKQKVVQDNFGRLMDD